MAALVAGCAAPEDAPGTGATPAPTGPSSSTAITPTATGTAACAPGLTPGAARVDFSVAYLEEERAFDGGAAASALATHTMRSWTDMRIVAHRNVSWTGEPGFEVVTVDGANGTATWRLGIQYMLPSRCVADRAADDARACDHWGGVSDVLVAHFDETGGWTADASSGCQPGG